jgi:TolB protein
MRKLSFALGLGAACVAVLGLAVASSRATYRGSNGLLVYEAVVGKHYQLFTIKPNGTGAHQITHLSDDAIIPSWSPDGRRIAFGTGVYQQGRFLDIDVVNADGSGLHAFGLKSSSVGGAPSRSPDGRHLVWADHGGFAVANPDGSGLRQLRVSGNNGSPVYTRDGKQIAFWRSEHNGTSINVVNANGGGVTRVRLIAGGLGDKIDWSPDGTRIAFNSGFDDNRKSGNVFTIKADGTGLVQLTHASGGKVNDGLDSWSPNGKQIAFVSNTSGTYEIYVMNADGTGVKQVSHGPEAHAASWGTHP